MGSKCVTIQLNSSLQGLFEQLNDLGVQYYLSLSAFYGYYELMCVVEREKMPILEDILAPYV